ncbi:MAG: hypothetical protein LBU09_02330 [Endomicrobium sp.]|jgi:hypothetical protein|nr:hypothetical protein [Endomicrobium sp.]
MLHPRTNTRIAEKTEEFRSRWISLRDGGADQETVDLAHDALKTLITIKNEYLIYDERTQAIMTALSKDELWDFQYLFRFFSVIENPDTNSEGHVNFIKDMRSGSYSKVSFLLFLALTKDTLSHEIFDVIARKLECNEISFTEDYDEEWEQEKLKIKEAAHKSKIVEPEKSDNEKKELLEKNSTLEETIRIQKELIKELRNSIELLESKKKK